MKTATKNTFTNQQICVLIQKHFPSAKVTAIKQLKGGTFNTLYQIEGTNELEKSVVLKTGPDKSISVPNHEKNTLRTEIHCYYLLRGLELPIPKILAYDFSREDVPCDYFFMEYMEGKSWYDVWPFKNSALMKELGRYTARIHSVECDWFGEINGISARRFSTWSGAFTFMVDNALYEIKKQELRLPYDEIRTVVYSRQELLDTVKTPALVNFDMWAGNVFLKRKQGLSISAIIDFERSFFGDPLASFVSAMFIYDDVEKEKDFMEGYNEVSKFPLKITSADREKMILYEMLVYLRGYCETQRYGFGLRTAERVGIRSMIRLFLWKLARLPKSKEA